MDGRRFDALARLFSRRHALRGLTAGVVAALGLRLDEAPVFAQQKKKKKKPTCSRCFARRRLCRRGRCRPCRRNRECGRQYGLELSHCIEGRCEECTSDAWCDFLHGEQFPYCVNKTCRQCRNTADCPPDFGCSGGGICLPKPPEPPATTTCYTTPVVCGAGTHCACYGNGCLTPSDPPDCECICCPNAFCADGGAAFNCGGACCCGTCNTFDPTICEPR